MEPDFRGSCTVLGRLERTFCIHSPEEWDAQEKYPKCCQEQKVTQGIGHNSLYPDEEPIAEIGDAGTVMSREPEGQPEVVICQEVN